MCAECDELKTAEFFMVPASEYGMGHGRVTVCGDCYDGPAKDMSYEETVAAVREKKDEIREHVMDGEGDA